METWKATIKEVGNDNLLMPTYMMPQDKFGYISDKKQREQKIKEYLIDFWGLRNNDVEWFCIEKIAMEPSV